MSPLDFRAHTVTELDIPRYADLVRKGMLQADDIATHRRPLEEINEALRAATAREGIQQMIRFTPER